MPPTRPPDAPEPTARTRRYVALAGGVGAARFLEGLCRVVAPQQVTAIVNTGDDRRFYGALVCPDLDIVTYTLADRVDRKQGYGLSGDTFHLMERLEALGHETWFRLGDADYAHCLHRTLALEAGRGLAEIADGLRRDLGVLARVLPMAEAPCPTYVVRRGGARTHFEEYMIRDGAPDDVASVDLGDAERAAPAPGVLEAIADADAIIVCPSNPVVSIGPILAVPGIRAAIEKARAPRVAISPIVGGAPVKGPASQLLRGIGVEVSARGVAEHYRPLIDGYVFDERDAETLEDIEGLGLEARAVDSMMVDPAAAARLAGEVVALLDTLASRKHEREKKS